MAIPIYIYCGTAAFGWLFTWFGDLCSYNYYNGDGDCEEENYAESLSIRMCSFLLSYTAIIPLVLTVSNRDNDPFLKRLAFHLQYGLMAILGCSITNPSSSSSGGASEGENDDDDGELIEAGLDFEESWYSVADKIYAFLTFLLLFAYTSRMNKSPSIMRQSPHEGHGITSRTFLVMFALVGLLPLVKRYPLHKIVPDGTEITGRARFYYSMSQCLGLAFILILFVPIHFGALQDQRRVTIAILGIQCVLAPLMFCGNAWSEWIRPELHIRLLFWPVVVLILAAIALFYEGLGKRKNETIFKSMQILATCWELRL